MSEILIPQPLVAAGARFVLVKNSDKAAFETGWEINNYDAKSPRLLEHLKNGGNYGVLSHNGICCIDIDNPIEFKKVNPGLPPTFLVQRANHYHVYFTCSDCPESMRKKFVTPWGDIRMGSNFYTVGPNCVHPSGDIYKIKHDTALADIKWSMIKKLIGTQPVTEDKKEPFVMPVKAQQRHYMLRSLVGSMVNRGNSFAAVLAACQAENLATCDPPKTPEFIEKEVISLYEYSMKKRELKLKEKEERLQQKNNKAEPPEQQPGTQISLDDCGNAIRMCRQYGNIIRHCEDWGKWFIWDGKRWREDNTNMIFYFAKKVAKGIYIEASNEQDNNRALEVSRFAHESCNNNRINAMVESTKNEHDYGVPITVDILDTDQFLINLENGTFDLRTYTLLPHDQQNMITKIANVWYDTTAVCPMWLGFLDRIFRGQGENKPKLIAFLQRACGYSLTGDTKEQIMFFLYGSGANGKSTFIDVIQYILGEYAAATESTTFTTSKADSIRNDIARLVGKRFVSASENSTESLLDESLVKKLTGNEKISARFLHKEFFEFYPEFKIWWAFNHQPYIRDNTNSIWRRILLIPFDEKIPDEEQDKVLAQKLKDEAPGIFNWMITGLKEYNRIGLAAPERVIVSTAEYREDQDILHDFINECCIVSTLPKSGALTSDTRVSAGKLHAAYVEWSFMNQARKEDLLSSTKFGKLLIEKGFERVRTETGKFYLGLKLK